LRCTTVRTDFCRWTRLPIPWAIASCYAGIKNYSIRPTGTCAVFRGSNRGDSVIAVRMEEDLSARSRRISQRFTTEKSRRKSGNNKGDRGGLCSRKSPIHWAISG
jgi:hypothetical protein